MNEFDLPYYRLAIHGVALAAGASLAMAAAGSIWPGRHRPPRWLARTVLICTILLALPYLPVLLWFPPAGAPLAAAMLWLFVVFVDGIDPAWRITGLGKYFHVLGALSLIGLVSIAMASADTWRSVSASGVYGIAHALPLHHVIASDVDKQKVHALAKLASGLVVLAMVYAMGYDGEGAMFNQADDVVAVRFDLLFLGPSLILEAVIIAWPAWRPLLPTRTAP